MAVTDSFLSFYDHLLNTSQLENGTQFLIPESLRTLILQRLGDSEVESDEGGRQFGGGGYGGCNDAYSAFAFLAFLFALLNFIQNNGGRRKRSVMDDQETMLASALMYQVNAKYRTLIGYNS